jgi:VWFA-related protein
MKRGLNIYSAVIFVALLLIGCSGGEGGSSSAPAAPTLSPQISAQISLDHDVAVLDSSSARQLSISNVGSANLNVGQISLTKSNSAFSIVSDNCSRQSVGPSATCTVVTKLTPTDQIDYSDSLIIPSNDSAHNPLVVNLTGKGRALNVNINEAKTDGCSSIPQVLKLLVSVTDYTGIPVDGLTVPKITIFENGIQKVINNITNPIINSSISVALVLDYSMSVSPTDRLSIETAAKSFIAQLQPNIDEASIIKFALTIGAKTSFTADQSVLNAAIDAPYPGNTGGTILYDAAFAAIDDTSARSNNRRAIIILSDGYDEESILTLNNIIDRSIEKGIPIFTITYLNSSLPKPEIMQQLAQATGGEAFVASSGVDMLSIYSKISTILSHQYLIEYDTSTNGGSSVSLDVKIDDNSDLGEDTKVITGCN